MGILNLVGWVIFCLLCGCAKLTYITTQSVEQIKLVSTGEKVEDVLKSKKVTAEHKEKIKKIEDYKKFFSDYFQADIGEIYKKVIFLSRESVSHLVISSSWEEIKPIKECFIFVGCFPYLGFFEKTDAIDYRNSMIKNGFSSHIRPVNAYSTLGNFNDRILSSFFHYSDRELAGLIFHELVHSVIFFKNGVNFNENLASFISDKLVNIYFKDSIQEIGQARRRENASKDIYAIISTVTSEINKQLQQFPKIERKNMTKLLIEEKFGEAFEKKLSQICLKYDLKKKFCTKFKKTWSPSELAAIGTYNELQHEISAFYEANFSSLQGFYNYLKAQYVNGTHADKIIETIKNGKK